MSLRSDLAGLRRRLEAQQPQGPEREPSSRQWLGVLEAFLSLGRREAPPDDPAVRELEESVALLQGYDARGKLTAHVEGHCNARLVIFAGWWNEEEGGPRRNRDEPPLGTPAALRPALEIDAWREEADAPAA